MSETYHPTQSGNLVDVSTLSTTNLLVLASFAYVEDHSESNPDFTCKVSVHRELERRGIIDRECGITLLHLDDETYSKLTDYVLEDPQGNFFTEVLQVEDAHKQLALTASKLGTPVTQTETQANNSVASKHPPQATAAEFFKRCLVKRYEDSLNAAIMALATYEAMPEFDKEFFDANFEDSTALLELDEQLEYATLPEGAPIIGFETAAENVAIFKDIAAIEA